MSRSVTPPFRIDHVGRLLRPRHLSGLPDLSGHPELSGIQRRCAAGQLCRWPTAEHQHRGFASVKEGDTFDYGPKVTVLSADRGNRAPG